MKQLVYYIRLTRGNAQRQNMFSFKQMVFNPDAQTDIAYVDRYKSHVMRSKPLLARQVASVPTGSQSIKYITYCGHALSLWMPKMFLVRVT